MLYDANAFAVLGLLEAQVGRLPRIFFQELTNELLCSSGL
jgi:hypothetical protein